MPEMKESDSSMPGNDGPRGEAAGSGPAEALLRSIAEGNLAGAKQALDAGADPNAKSHEGTPAVVMAVELGDEACLRALLAAGASPNCFLDGDGNAALARAIVQNNRAGCLSALSEAGAKLDVGYAPLCRAASMGSLDALNALIKAGADVNGRDSGGWTPLMLACEHGAEECARSLIGAGARLNPPLRARCDSAAGSAVASGHEKCLELLIAAGIDLDQADDGGWTPVMLAARDGRTEALSMLIEAGANIDAKLVGRPLCALSMAAANGHFGCLELLVSAGASLAAPGEDGAPVIVETARQGHARCLRLLLAKGLSPDAKDKEGVTALMGAAASNNAECVRILIAHGACLDAVDQRGAAALTHAARYQAVESLAELMRAGGDLESKAGVGIDLHGALEEARGSGRGTRAQKCVEMLEAGLLKKILAEEVQQGAKATARLRI